MSCLNVAFDRLRWARIHGTSSLSLLCTGQLLNPISSWTYVRFPDSIGQCCSLISFIHIYICAADVQCHLPLQEEFLNQDHNTGRELSRLAEASQQQMHSRPSDVPDSQQQMQPGPSEASGGGQHSGLRNADAHLSHGLVNAPQIAGSAERGSSGGINARGPDAGYPAGCSPAALGDPVRQSDIQRGGPGRQNGTEMMPDFAGFQAMDHK